MTVLTPGKQLCARCATPRRAIVVIPMSWDGQDYELPLCAQHEDAADMAMNPWCRIAVPIEDQREELSPPVKKAAPSFPVINNRHIVINKGDVKEGGNAGPTLMDLRRAANNKLIWQGSEYELTLHATERMEERSIPFPIVRQVLGSRNKVTRPGSTANTTKHVSENGRVVIVTDDQKCTVVTVARNQAEADADLALIPEGVSNGRKRA